MKKHLLILALGFALVSPPASFAQANKPAPAVPAVPNNARPAEPPKPAEKTPDKIAAKPAASAAAKQRPFPFNTTVDELDPIGRSLTHINKDGKKVKLLVTETTVFKTDAAGKKFEDLKIGDAVNGSRIKLNDTGTEYEVVSITFMGVKTAKPAAKK